MNYLSLKKPVFSLFLLGTLVGCSPRPDVAPLQGAVAGAMIAGTWGRLGTIGAGSRLVSTTLIGAAVGGAIGKVSTSRPALAQRLNRHGAQVFEIGDQVNVVIPSDLLFMTDSDRLAPRDSELIPLLLAYISTYQRTFISIDAYTDNVSSVKHNRSLSARQAERIRSLLWVAEGYDYRLLIARGHSAFNEVASNYTPAGSALNRRIELFWWKEHNRPRLVGKKCTRCL